MARRREGPARGAGGTAAAPPEEHPAEHRTQFSGNLGPGLPQRNMPTPGANLTLKQTGLPHALGAHDPPCCASEECPPGLLPMGQPSRWTHSDNTLPLLSGAWRLGFLPCALPGARSCLHGCHPGTPTSKQGRGLGWQTGPPGVQGPGVDTGLVSGALGCTPGGQQLGWSGQRRGDKAADAHSCTRPEHPRPCPRQAATPCAHHTQRSRPSGSAQWAGRQSPCA